MAPLAYFLALVSVIVYWGYQANFKSVYFFTKRFWVNKKHQSVKQTTFSLLEVCACKKPLPLLFFVRLFFVLLANVCLWVFLHAQNLFVEKNKQTNRFEIGLIASIHYTTDVYPYQSACREFVCMYLFLFVRISFYLW